MARSTIGLALGALWIALGTAHCGSTTSSAVFDGGTEGDSAGPPPQNLPLPTNHRPTAVACSMQRPPGINEDAGAQDAGFEPCTSDSQCTMGTNGRCTPSGHNAGPSCTYDSCFSDKDCGANKVCECGGTSSPGRFANACLIGNCSVDSDCGPGGYCSPTYGTSCGAFGGVVGYYCHTPRDECTNDNECNEGGIGYCAWQPTESKWVCEYSFCAG